MFRLRGLHAGLIPLPSSTRPQIRCGRVRKVSSAFVRKWSDGPLFQQCSKPSHRSSAAFLDRFAWNLAEDADGGAEAFQNAVNIRRQLSSILHKKFSHCQIYPFGSCLFLSNWDGVGDIDLALLDPVGWQKEPKTWPGRETFILKEVHKSLVEQLTDWQKDQPEIPYPTVEIVTGVRTPLVRVQTRDARKLERQWRLQDIKSTQVSLRLKQGTDKKKLFRQTISLRSIEERQHIEQFAGTVESEHEWHILSCGTTNSAVAMRSQAFEGTQEIVERRFASAPFYGPDLFFSDFDLTARGFGVRNSHLIKSYLDQHAFCRPGLIFIKKWGKTSGINNSKQGMLTSYALTVMWICYLRQVGVVGHIYPESVPTLPEQPEQDFIYRDLVLTEESDQCPQRESLGDLLIGFFRFYCEKFDWENAALTLNSDTGLKTKVELGWELPYHGKRIGDEEEKRFWNLLSIEDPYELNLNLGRHICPTRLAHILTEFRFAYETVVQLSSCPPKQSDLLLNFLVNGNRHSLSSAAKSVANYLIIKNGVDIACIQRRWVTSESSRLRPTSFDTERLLPGSGDDLNNRINSFSTFAVCAGCGRRAFCSEINPCEESVPNSESERNPEGFCTACWHNFNQVEEFRCTLVPLLESELQVGISRIQHQVADSLNDSSSAIEVALFLKRLVNLEVKHDGFLQPKLSVAPLIRWNESTSLEKAVLSSLEEVFTISWTRVVSIAQEQLTDRDLAWKVQSVMSLPGCIYCEARQSLVFRSVIK